MNLAFVHEFKQSLHVVGGGSLQDDIASTSMAWRCTVEQLLEVFTARCQDHLMRFERTT